MTGTDLAVIISIVVGYVTGIIATLRYLAGRMDRLEDRMTRLEERMVEMQVVLARIDERLGHLEHRP